MNYDKIGKFILERRKAKNWTQKDLAERIGVTDKAISKWERGQGCPDVSILEILSKELDCSILELLKGREIENEIISVTEADDYVKSSIDFSKKSFNNKIKTILSRTIEVIIISIIILLIYLNVLQMIYLKKEYQQKVSSDVYRQVTEKLEKIEKNISIIKKDNGKFSNEDYKTIVDNLTYQFDSINKLKIIDYIKSRKTLTYTINDIIILNMDTSNYMYELDILDILYEYDSSEELQAYKDVAIYSFFSNSESSRAIKSRPLLTYKYIFYNDPLLKYTNYPSNEEIYYIYVNIESDLSKLCYLTELVMKVGGIND